MIIKPMVNIARAGTEEAQVDQIFFELAGTKDFVSESDKAAFRYRWLGVYLDQHSQSSFVALAEDGVVLGYLVGCLDSRKFCKSVGKVSDLKTFEPLLTDYPGHLHLNVRADAQRLGIGRTLISTFVEYIQAKQVRGVHAITALKAANVPFYEACDFRRIEQAEVDGRELLFVGRRWS